ncbi:MAG TPA: PKD domain-containing protein [Gemmatimonadales bacterium]|nr:PKD domain-containing protein [Gemmatimonadales bacterium]
MDRHFGRNLLVVLSAAVLPACIADQQQQDSVTKCVVEPDGVWLQIIVDEAVSSPDRCPYNIANYRTAQQTFAGYIDGDPSYVVSGVSEAATNIYTESGSLSAGPKFDGFAGFPPQSQPSISYFAGLGQNPHGSETGEDIGVVQVTSSAGTAVGTADLTYYYGIYSNITASTFDPGPVTFTSSISNYRAPTTYRWWRDGTALANTGSSISTTLAAGRYTFKVVVKDADGDSGYVSKMFTIGDPTNCPSVCPK